MTFIGDIVAFFEKNGFAFEMLLANFIFVIPLERRSRFFLRAAASFLFFLSVTYLWSFFDTRYTIWDIPKFISLVALAMVLLLFCFKISLRSALFCEISAFATQHSAYKIGEVLKSITDIKLGFSHSALIYLLVVPIVYVSYYFMYAKKLKLYNLTHFKNNQIILLSVSLMLVAVILGQYSYHDDYNIYITLAVYDILCCLLTLSCQYSILKSASMREEVNIMEQMLFLQKKQMKSSKETLDTINIKFHDLKHQLSQFEGRVSDAELNELKNALNMYELSLQTGNEALDVIIAEKAFKCWKNNIKIYCIADGKALAFMRSSDIYSLFGNAIDNAIEAVSKIQNKDMRNLSVTVKKTMGMVFIHFENAFESQLVFVNELPKTTKKNTLYHGFGMKSIKMIAEKYNGIISINTHDNIFQLNIIMPEKACI